MTNNPKGYVSFILHAHLPFIHHPESDNYLEEEWLFEAISETYIPLLTNFKKLEEEGVNFRLTMSLTPPLLSMLASPLLQKKYIKYLNKHIELCEKEVIRTADNQRLNDLSKYYLDRYSSDLHIFRDVYDCNLITGFKHFQDIRRFGNYNLSVQLMAIFLFCMLMKRRFVRKLQFGVQTYEKYLGRKPRRYMASRVWIC